MAADSAVKRALINTHVGITRFVNTRDPEGAGLHCERRTADLQNFYGGQIGNDILKRSDRRRIEPPVT
jgi:hypothetical protein